MLDMICELLREQPYQSTGQKEHPKCSEVLKHGKKFER
jgi:hypothetical protein